MNKEQFMAKLNELKAAKHESEYRLTLYYEGHEVGCIWYDGDLDAIEVEDRDEFVLIYDNTFRLYVDDAELESIYG